MKRPYKLPRKFTEKWIATLRSGKYSQIVGSLYSSGRNAYCALGVACVASGIEPMCIDGATSIPKIEAEEVGIPLELTKGKFLASRIIDMNDTLSMSFPAIAQWIEENVELYETEEQPKTEKHEEVQIAEEVC